MEYAILTGDPARIQSPCLILGVFSEGDFPPATAAVDQAADGTIRRIAERGDLPSKAGDTLMLFDLPGVAAERVLLVGLGKPAEFKPGAYAKAVSSAAKFLDQGGAVSALCTLSALDPAGADRYRVVRDTVTAAEEGVYRFDRCKGDPKPPKTPLLRIDLLIPDEGQRPVAESALAHGQAIAGGQRLARDLGNLPGNICTPAYLAEQALALAVRHDSIQTKVLDVRELEALGMGAFLSVARGSRQPAKLILMEYGRDISKSDSGPVVLVGKGLTFDAGGISIKPAEAMDEMKFDMCGGASVLGTIAACAELQLPLHVVGIVPASENLPDGNANKPGDIVTSMAGITIEVLNTDAEGRLILCDALTYAERYNPAAVVDIATLTGACVVALGRPASGLLANDDGLAGELLAAGDRSGDRAWRLPLWEDYQKQLDSNFADIANIGGREGGAITAACFLSRFTKKFKWAHLDIAGSAWLSGKEKGATGRPVALLTQFLLRRCKLAE